MVRARLLAGPRGKLLLIYVPTAEFFSTVLDELSQYLARSTVHVLDNVQRSFAIPPLNRPTKLNAPPTA